MGGLVGCTCLFEMGRQWEGQRCCSLPGAEVAASVTKGGTAQQQTETTITPTREKRWCQATSSAWGIGGQIWLFLLARERSPSTQRRYQFWFWKVLLTYLPWSHLCWCGTSPAAQTGRERGRKGQRAPLAVWKLSNSRKTTALHSPPDSTDLGWR